MEKEITHPAPPMTAERREEQLRELTAQICRIADECREKLDTGAPTVGILTELDFIGVLMRRLNVVRHEAKKTGLTV